MRTFLAYLFTLLLLAASVHTCKASDEYEDYDFEDYIEEELSTPIKLRSSIFKEDEDTVGSIKDSEEQKLIVTICKYSDYGDYSCKDLP